MHSPFTIVRYLAHPKSQGRIRPFCLQPTMVWSLSILKQLFRVRKCQNNREQQLSILDIFRKKPASSSETARRPVYDHGPHGSHTIGDATAQLAAQLSDQLAGIRRTEEDVWRFLVEEFDYIVDCGEPAAGLLAMSGFKMLEIEYEGRKSENSYVGKPNPGVVLLNKASSVFASKFDEDIADMTIAYAFIMFTDNNQAMLTPLRIKYATHFHNNCVSQGSFQHADRWGDVLDAPQRSGSV